MLKDLWQSMDKVCLIEVECVRKEFQGERCSHSFSQTLSLVLYKQSQSQVSQNSSLSTLRLKRLWRWSCNQKDQNGFTKSTMYKNPKTLPLLQLKSSWLPTNTQYNNWNKNAKPINQPNHLGDRTMCFALHTYILQTPHTTSMKNIKISQINIFLL